MVSTLRFLLMSLPAAFEIFLLACIFYYVILFFRGTRGAQVLWGLAFTFFALFLLTRVFNLNVLNWLIMQLSVYLAVALLVIFQPEIRRALAELGRQPVFVPGARHRGMVDLVVAAVDTLAQRRIGALIAFEREIGTRAIQETGTALDSKVSQELLVTVFFPHSPLHDGGIIVRGERVAAAGCLFPLSQQEEMNPSLGTRHRAALGLTEETDAVVVVVSEETGIISVAYKGRLRRGLDRERLQRLLTALLLRGRTTKSRWLRFKEKLDLTPDALARAERLEDEEGAHA